LLFALIRRFFIFDIFSGLKPLIEKDLINLFDLRVRSFFIFASQDALTAQSWVYFIRNKLKKNTYFGAIMRNITPILNQLLYTENILIGYKITCSGRTSRRGRASFSIRNRGKLPLSTVISFVSYAFGTVILKNSICGIKV
jgi:ribosomal protein S3